ncbi:MAG TPA: transposase [Streptosporangiaceae bacterium]|nr:transposase [Streptosporangiaceae bacterium]
MPDPPLPEAASEELRALREANAQLRALREANAQLREALKAKDAQLSARGAELEAARVGGRLHFVHVAGAEFLTAMHAGGMRTGGRSADDIDAGGVLPGCTARSSATATRGTGTWPTTLHAWCGSHGLRNLRGVYESDPDGRLWARSMADLLIWANSQATAGRARLGDAQLAEITAWYRGAVAKGITDNQGRRGLVAKDGLRLARRCRDQQDMILRFAADLAVGFTSNQAERDVRPVKVQQRSSGGCSRNEWSRNRAARTPPVDSVPLSHLCPGAAQCRHIVAGAVRRGRRHQRMCRPSGIGGHRDNTSAGVGRHPPTGIGDIGADRYRGRCARRRGGTATIRHRTGRRGCKPATSG